MIRILLAEDDDVMREYLARALTSAGYDVTAVDRGTAAVPYIDSGTFDLLLSDIVMPEMDGIELAQHTAKAAPQTQVMFITGFAAVSLRAEETVPQAKLLSKPFHRSEEHTSELQSLMRISYAVFCLTKKNITNILVHKT